MPSNVIQMARNPTPPIDGDWFRTQLATAGRSQAELARHLNIDKSSLTRMFGGYRKMQLVEAQDIARFLGVPIAEVLRRAGLNPVSQRDRICIQIGTLRADGVIHLADEGLSHVAPWPMPEGTVAVAVDPDLPCLSGTLFLPDPQRGVQPDAIGRMAVFQRRDREALEVGIVRPGRQPGLYSVSRVSADHDIVEDAELVTAAYIHFIRP